MSMPKPGLVLQRKLTGGVGLGAALTTLGVSVISATVGYQPSPDEVIAAQTLVSFAIGWWIKEDND